MMGIKNDVMLYREKIRFAFLPTKLTNGKTVWFRKVVLCQDAWTAWKCTPCCGLMYEPKGFWKTTEIKLTPNTEK
jgi:hypothetical protein